MQLSHIIYNAQYLAFAHTRVLREQPDTFGREKSSRRRARESSHLVRKLQSIFANLELTKVNTPFGQSFHVKCNAMEYPFSPGKKE